MAVTPLNTLFNWFKNGNKPPDVQFWAWMTSFFHKDELIPSASISGLQQLLDAKVDKKDLIQNKGVFDPTKAYVFSAELAEYVSFTNEASPDAFFHVERWFRLLSNTTAGESPETAPAKWKHIGTVLGEIAIEDVVGLREELDALNEGGGTGGGHIIQNNVGDALAQRPVLQIKGVPVTDDAENGKTVVDVSGPANHINGADEGKHTTNQIIEQAAHALIGTAANAKNSEVIAKIVQYLSGTINANSINDPNWLISEQRLAILTKTAEDVVQMAGAALLLDIFAPPGVESLLRDNNGWANETKTLTGDNTTGALGEKGAHIWLNDAVFAECVDHTTTYAVYKRNRAIDVMDPLNNTQDAAIINQLDPSYVYPDMTVTGISTDTGWNLTTQVKVITGLPTRWGMWFIGGVDGSGYRYDCFWVNGTTSFWKRTGMPEAISKDITASSHPTLTTNLLAHDFSASSYTPISGDEAAEIGQCYYDIATRKEFELKYNGKWELMRG